MEILDSIRNRRSRREYLNRDIPEECINEILECALRAPFGGPPKPYCQVAEFIVIRNKEKKKQLSLHYDNRQFLQSAPVIIACCANKKNDPNYKEWLLSTALAIQNILIASEAMDIGSCILSCFLYHEKHIEDKEILRSILKLPNDIELVALVSLGYKSESERLQEKMLRQFTDVISYDIYGKSMQEEK